MVVPTVVVVDFRLDINKRSLDYTAVVVPGTQKTRTATTAVIHTTIGGDPEPSTIIIV